jgi:hypothetical protein
MTKISHTPASDRLSVLSATILLAYASTRFINLPSREFEMQLAGIYLTLEINVRTLVGLLVAGLMACGADWLLRGHPAIKGKYTLEHWLLPALTSWVIGIPLYRLPLGWQWLISFVIGGALLMIVLIAEYITIDPEDRRYATATAGLTAVSFALLLMLAIALRTATIRLILMLPILTAAGGLISLHTLHLRIPGNWSVWPSVVLAFVVAQLTASLHYWPLSPVAFGLALTGPAYALISLVGGLSEGRSLRQAIVEPVLVLTILWGTAIWVH